MISSVLLWRYLNSQTHNMNECVRMIDEENPRYVDPEVHDAGETWESKTGKRQYWKDEAGQISWRTPGDSCKNGHPHKIDEATGIKVAGRCMTCVNDRGRKAYDKKRRNHDR